MYDFLDYASMHSSSPSNITDIYDGILVYPDIHPMNYWEELKYSDNITYVSRYGDREIVDQFADALELDKNPDELVAIAKNTGKIMVKNKIHTSRGSGTLVCGSPNEVASDPYLDDYFDVVHQDSDCVGCLDAYGDYFSQKQTVWTMTMLEAEDQLCQKVRTMYQIDILLTCHQTILLNSALSHLLGTRWHGHSTNLSTLELQPIHTIQSQICTSMIRTQGIALGIIMI